MPANEFEKQLQQKMDEFRPEPSADVWKKVEEEIRKKKRRRIIIFFILPTALLLLAYSVYYFSTSNSKNEIVQQLPVIDTDTNTNQKEQPSQPTQNTDVNKINDEQKAVDAQKPEVKEPLVTKENINPNQVITVPAKNDNVVVTTNDPSKARKTSRKVKDDIVANKPIRDKQDNSVVIDSNIPSTQKNDQSLTKQPEPENKKNSESIAKVVPGPETKKQEIPGGEKTDVVPKTDSAVAKNTEESKDDKKAIAKKDNKKPKLRFGIDFSAGISGISNHNAFEFFDGQKSMDRIVYGNSGSTQAGNAQPRVIQPPSSVNANISFKTGVAAELQISKKSRFSVGLRYAFASNSIKVGGRKDSSIVFNYSTNAISRPVTYYTSVKQNDYTNKFHFIELPVAYHLQLGKGNKLPLQWNVGVSLGYLVSTNGLVYDTANLGIYFRNKDAFNKFHFNVGTGFSFRIKGKKGAEWILGPEVSFDMRQLLNNRFDQSQYPLYGGMSARFLLPQRKNK